MSTNRTAHDAAYDVRGTRPARIAAWERLDTDDATELMSAVRRVTSGTTDSDVESLTAINAASLMTGAPRDVPGRPALTERERAADRRTRALRAARQARRQAAAAVAAVDENTRPIGALPAELVDAITEGLAAADPSDRLPVSATESADHAARWSMSDAVRDADVLACMSDDDAAALTAYAARTHGRGRPAAIPAAAVTAARTAWVTATDGDGAPFSRPVHGHQRADRSNGWQTTPRSRMPLVGEPHLPVGAHGAVYVVTTSLHCIACRRPQAHGTNGGACPTGAACAAVPAARVMSERELAAVGTGDVERARPADGITAHGAALTDEIHQPSRKPVESPRKRGGSGATGPTVTGRAARLGMTR